MASAPHAALQRSPIVEGSPLAEIAEQLERLGVDGRASFQRTFTHRPGALYRLTYPAAAGKRASGPALKPVKAGL